MRTSLRSLGLALVTVVASGCTPTSVQPDDANDGAIIDAPNDVRAIDDSVTDGDIAMIDASVDADAVVEPDAPSLPDIVDVDFVAACTRPHRPRLTLPSQTLRDALDVSHNANTSCTDPGAAVGGDVLYPLETTMEEGIVLATTAPIDTVVSLRRVCEDDTSEIACNDSPGYNAFLRTIAPAGDYFVLVDEVGSTMPADFELRFETFVPAPNALCARAISVADGTSLHAQDAARSASATDACRPSTMPDGLYYSAVVPAGSRLVVQAHAAGGADWVPVIHVLDSCAATECLATTTADRTSHRAFLSFPNEGTAPRTVYFSVDATVPSEAGTFDLDVSIPTSSANVECAQPLALVAGSPVLFESSPSTTEHLMPPLTCGGEFFGPAARYYSVQVPAREALLLATEAGGDGFVFARALASCAGPCLADTAWNELTGPEDGMIYSNRTDTPRDVIIAASSTAPFYNLRPRFAAEPANLDCARATSVTASTRLRDQRLPTSAGPSMCRSDVVGGALFYEVVIPAGFTLRASLGVTAGAGFWNPIAMLADTCGDTTCLADSGPVVDARAAVLQFTNAATSPRTVTMMVGADRGVTDAMVEIDVRLERPLYVESAIPTSCDALTAATTLPMGDDTVSPRVPLPFAFTLLGDAVDSFAVDSNGITYLLAGGGVPSSSFESAPVPSAAAPSGFIAPFWDDLDTVESGASSLRWQNFTGTRPHLTIEWAHVTVLGATGSDFTFQAKLFRDTGEIEFHYCQLANPAYGPLVFGARATIGIESLDGMRGYQHSFRTGGSIGAGVSLRFVPAP